MQLNYEMFHYLSDEKKNWVDPNVIELKDNSEPEDDLDYIPPSPIPEKMPYIISQVDKRFVFFIYNVICCSNFFY